MQFFDKEDEKVWAKIYDYVDTHPRAKQVTIAEVVGCSQGLVSKVLNSLRGALQHQAEYKSKRKRVFDVYDQEINLDLEI